MSRPSFCRSFQHSLIVLPCVLALTASAVSAQSSRRWSLQGSAIFVGGGGDAFEGVSAGPGGELQIRFTPGRFSLGIGGQYSLHKSDIFDDGVKRDVHYAGGFIEPRMVFDVGKDSYAPYLAARFAYLEQSASVSDVPLQAGGVTDVKLSASGSQANIGGGVLVRLSSRVNLDLGATVGFIRFGKASITFSGQTIEGDADVSGQNLVLRAGLAIGLGK